MPDSPDLPYERPCRRLGVIAGLWRYPVKSMQGEAVESAALADRGLIGDRAYAIRDHETGHIASAKHPRKWTNLFACSAAFAESPLLGAPLPPVLITLPDRSVVRSDDPHVDAILSRVLGRAVSIVTDAPSPPTREADRTPLDSLGGDIIREEVMATASPAGTFFDYAPVHLLTTATLARLARLYPEGRFEVGRFRPNIVVTPDSAGGFVENGWPGRSLALGGDVELAVIDPAPRCLVTTLPQGELPRDPGILRAVVTHSSAASATLAPGVILPGVVGVYARPLREGLICVGDVVRFV